MYDVNVYVSMYECMSAYVYLRVCIYVHMYMYVCARACVCYLTNALCKHPLFSFFKYNKKFPSKGIFIGPCRSARVLCAFIFTF